MKDCAMILKLREWTVCNITQIKANPMQSIIGPICLLTFLFGYLGMLIYFAFFFKR